MLPVRRPYRQADENRGIPFECDLARLVSVRVHDPEVGVTAAVRKEDDFAIARPW
jgi:hypothetical protein